MIKSSSYKCKFRNKQKITNNKILILQLPQEDSKGLSKVNLKYEPKNSLIKNLTIKGLPESYMKMLCLTVSAHAFSMTSSIWAVTKWQKIIKSLRKMESLTL